jgi:hypothetical protein
MVCALSEASFFTNETKNADGKSPFAGLFTIGI